MSFNSTLIFSLFAIFITVLQPPLVATERDFLSPLLSPVIGNFCNSVGCGKGKCKMSENSDFEYECECDPGWKQTISNSSDFKFLPCVIPNCTLNYSCSEASPSPQPQATPSNASIFEPCQWANCGGGECSKTSTFAYTCQCKEGYSNLFNNTSFPCFKECSIGGDCRNLGLAMPNRSTTPPPSLAVTGNNQGWSQKHKVFRLWTIPLVTSVAALAL